MAPHRLWPAVLAPLLPGILPAQETSASAGIGGVAALLTLFHNAGGYVLGYRLRRPFVDIAVGVAPNKALLSLE